MSFYTVYKRQYHFSLNFFSLFLLVTFIPDILGLPPSLFTYGLWVIKAALASWLIIRYRKRLYDLQWREKLFLFVASVYFINIFIDVFWQKYPVGIGDPIDLLAFSLSILIALSFRYDRAFCSNSSFYFFILTLSLGLVIAFFLAKEAPLPLIGRYNANSTVNAINYGQMGSALSLISVYGYINKSFKYSKLIYPLLFLLGLISILKAGSRSPIVVIAVVCVFYFFAKSGFVRGLLITGFSILVLWLSIGYLIQLSDAVGSGIVTRILAAIDGGDTSGRDMIYANAISIIKDSPILGSFYLVPSGLAKGYYPHNFFLEAFMATGLLGGLPFVAMIILALIKSFKLLRQRHVSGWIVLLFLQMIVYGMFSSSLYSSQDFWAFCVFVLSIDGFRKKRIRRIKKSEPKAQKLEPALI